MYLSRLIHVSLRTSNSMQQARRDMARLKEFMDALVMSDPALSERMALFTSQPDRFDHDASSSRSVATVATINNLRVSMTFSFERILAKARVYRNANRNTSTQSFKTIITSDTKWSQLSGLSLSQISNISVICLPVNTHELGNSHIVRSMETDSGGESIGLHQVAAMGDSAMVRLLGANKDYNNEIGRTAFSAAANRRGAAAIRALFKLDANKEDYDIQSRKTPFFAGFNWYKRRVSVDTKGRTELHIAAMNGRNDVVRSLVELGVDTEARDIMGWTALHSAVQNGRYDVVRLLIQLGVNKTAQDNEGRTALHLATPNCPNDMVRILLELGVNMETRDKYGKTALHWGALYENASNIRLLLEFGANILARDREGWTAHTYAVHGRHATTIQLLSGLVPPMRLRVPMA